VGDEPLTPQKAADTLLAWVEETAPGAPGVAPRDRNDSLLCAAYGRAYRCFTSIRELAGRAEPDDALILSRSLLSIALRSLWLTAPDNAAERKLRLQQASLSYFEELKKMVTEEQAAGLEVQITAAEIQESINRLRAADVAAMPNDRDLATSLELDAAYTTVYRPGSDTTHYSIGSALDGFLELTTAPNVGPVSLQKPEPQRADEALAKAAIVYGVFLHLSDPVIQHGLGRRARDLLAQLVAEVSQ
jgi:hypothetical protein